MISVTAFWSRPNTTCQLPCADPMDEAHKIIINTDGISDAEKLTPKFQKAYAEMLAQLTAPGFAHVLACHEAAHLFYLTMMGMKTYDPFPAKIEYDAATNDYGGTLASVTPGDIPKWTPGKFADWFTLAAKAHAAWRGNFAQANAVPVRLRRFG